MSHYQGYPPPRERIIDELMRVTAELDALKAKEAKKRIFRFEVLLKFVIGASFYWLVLTILGTKEIMLADWQYWAVLVTMMVYGLLRKGDIL